MLLFLFGFTLLSHRQRVGAGHVVGTVSLLIRQRYLRVSPALRLLYATLKMKKHEGLFL